MSLTVDSDLVSAYAFYAALLCLKMFFTSVYTVINRLKNKVSHFMKSIVNRISHFSAILTFYIMYLNSQAFSNPEDAKFNNMNSTTMNEEVERVRR